MYGRLFGTIASGSLLFVASQWFFPEADVPTDSTNFENPDNPNQRNPRTGNKKPKNTHTEASSYDQTSDEELSNEEEFLFSKKDPRQSTKNLLSFLSFELYSSTYLSFKTGKKPKRTRTLRFKKKKPSTIGTICSIISKIFLPHLPPKCIQSLPHP